VSSRRTAGRPTALGSALRGSGPGRDKATISRSFCCRTSAGRPARDCACSDGCFRRSFPRGDEIKAEHLADVLRRPGAAGDAAAPAEAVGSLQDFKASAERAFLVQKLRESRWNISATATAIGTPRSNLYKLEQYAISQEKDG